MKVYGFLIDRISVACKKCCRKVYDYTDNGENNHAVCVYFGRVKHFADAVGNYKHRACQENYGGYKTAKHRVTTIAVGVFFVGMLAAFLFEKVGYTDAKSISRVMKCVGNNRHTAREKSADNFKNRKA